MSEIYQDIPTYDNGNWTTTSFDSREEFSNFIFELFKEPGKYNFNETTNKVFISESVKFKKDGVYTTAPFKSKDFISYWDDQKTKCRKGVIVKDKDNTWFLAREYYMWLNFLPIFDKEIQQFGFAKIRDAQYHLALYELLAELNYKHAAILKKRQIASSYYHMGKFINQQWFEAGVTLKMGASLKDYINEKGSWKFLQEYAAFLNEHTAWYRPMSPDKVMMWQQKIQVRRGDRNTEVGLKGTIQGMSFEKDPTNGVGGPVKYFFHEEAGIAPKMDQTYEYMRPAMRSGLMTTGMFIAAGSVGDLSQCNPLRDMILNPLSKDIYAVETDLIDDKGTIGMSGLFIPEQWSMPPHIDEYGNSLVEDALKALDEQFEKWKKELSPEDYQLRISQHPRNIKEAFDHRTVSVFPTHLLAAQERRIEEKEYAYEFLDISTDSEGKPVVTKSNKRPIMEFPVNKKTEDKTGCLVVWERPIPNPEFAKHYYASIDPVSEGKAEYVENMIFTPDGQKRIGNIKINDFVIGVDGIPTKVIGVYPQGKKELYRVTFNDGFSVLVCKEHLWSVKASDNDKQDYHVLSVEDLLDQNKSIKTFGLGRNKTKEYTTKVYYKKTNNQLRWKIPISKPIMFKKQNLSLDPYFLGAILGDGSISQRSIRFTTADLEILNYLSQSLPADVSIKQISKYDYRISTNKSRNKITQKLRELNLMGTNSKTKFIPEIYFQSGVEERLNLLQGLMDTDGYCGNHGAEFYSISKDLAYGVVKLCQSLGGIAKIRKKITNRKVKNGVGYIYVVRVILPSQFNPFRLKRKAELYKPTKNFTRYISNIEFEKIDEAVCISVESSDNLYLTEHAIVTHNTNTSESLCSIYIMKAPLQVTKVTGVETETYIEQGKLVAAWCGRYDDINKTHQQLELIIEWYNAWAVIENNISLFIQYMISRKKQKYLVPKSQIMFLKDLGSNANVFQEYGWKNTGTLFKAHLLSYAIEYCKEELDVETKTDGTIVRTKYGIERIPDPMLLKEMREYADGVNVDRLVSFAALVAFMRIQESNRGFATRTIMDDMAKNLQKSENLFKLNRSPFRHMGGSGNSLAKGITRSPFKNIK
jgi:hypothetical protein